MTMDESLSPLLDDAQGIFQIKGHQLGTAFCVKHPASANGCLCRHHGDALVHQQATMLPTLQVLAVRTARDATDGNAGHSPCT